MPQKKIATIESMPNAPQKYKLKDWQAAAQNFDKLVFDFKYAPEFEPLIWRDTSHHNFPVDSFGIRSYVGDPRQGADRYEGIVILGAVLGASFAGIDKSAQEGNNYVLGLENLFNEKNGRAVISNSTDSATDSFWYSILPSIDWYYLLEKYPDVKDFNLLARHNSDRWYEAIVAMGGEHADFNYTLFNFKTMQPERNGQWTEPDAAAGLAWLMLVSYLQWHDEKYLQASKWCLDFLEKLPTEKNPMYEILLPFGAYAAARMNAQFGTHYNVEKLVTWCFNESNARPGWGIISAKWQDYEAYGLAGSVSDRGGYAFALNSFVMPLPLLALVKYDPSYTSSFAKWMLNVASNARYFFPDEIAPELQSDADRATDYKNAIAYEGIMAKFHSYTPYATGDARAAGWARTNFGLYGSSYMGIFAALIHSTNVEKIIQLNLDALDICYNDSKQCVSSNAAKFPAKNFLYYNPYNTAQKVTFKMPSGFASATSLVGRDLITGKIILQKAGDGAEFILNPVQTLYLHLEEPSISSK